MVRLTIVKRFSAPGSSEFLPRELLHSRSSLKIGAKN